ncbi:hypothetical protein [Prescottella subtropica]|uniref:hypothetical protein n=1 Tax=Prescottella subtropica TaxID=2545757 RepID=UPI0010F51C30|nr:hypothetical protein [Prescottella subtropica]
MSNTTTDTAAANYPARHALLKLIEERRQLTERVDAAAITALREHGALRYPDATTLLLDSNGYPDEYVLHSVLTGDGSPAAGNANLAEDDDLHDVVGNLPRTAIRYDKAANLWKVALR